MIGEGLSWYRHMAFAVVLMLFSVVAFAADECPSGIEAVTTKDPSVPVRVLEERVKPLTRCELQAEAEAWLLVLKVKVKEISDSEIAAIYKKEEIKKEEQAQSALDQAAKAKSQADPDDVKETSKEASEAVRQAEDVKKKASEDAAVRKAIETAAQKAAQEGKAVGDAAESADAKAQIKTALIAHATDLMAERTAIIDRFNIVLTELEAKGGDRKQYDQYIKAVSGIKVDVTDASATWTTVTGWLTSPEGGIRWAMNIIQFLVILLVFYLLSIVLGKATEKALARSRNLTLLLSEFIVTSTRRLVLFIGFFVGLSALEVNVGPVLAIIGAAGFVIAFALQNSLSNFASGILMLIYRPFDTGDFVNVAGVVGKVESMNLLSTQLRTPDNQLVVVPNNSVWGDVITNITGINQRRVDLVFGIGYGDDIDKAQGILEDIVNNHALVLKDPAPVVKLHELADSSVNFVCRPWTTPDSYWDVYWDITREVKRRFDAEGVSIPFPQRDVHIYQEKPAST